MKNIALIPAYRPDERLAGLVSELMDRGAEVIVVDDGSGSEFEGFFDLPCKVISYTDNRGKGAAIKTGLSYIYENTDAPYTVCTLDADGQHSVDDAMHLCGCAADFPDELILGCRRFDGENVPARSKVGNRVVRTVFGVCSGTPVSDTQTGLRAFSDRLVHEMTEIEGDRYEYEMNVLFAFSGTPDRIREVPIQTIYIGDNSTSHFNTVRDAARITGQIVKFSASSLAAFAVDYLFFCLLSGFGLMAANIGARVISSVFNFTVNKRVVFKDGSSGLRAAVKYFALAAGILTVNTFLLSAFTASGMNEFAAKIVTELIMFSVSFTVQKLFIFRKPSSVSA
ncbi:MAG: bifunctional glycosyltransferase family 2/GtrA family protein [Oscillospiraceae bacterium]|nr:bifunctional glycosyltransferase family 2/GtrA family protein [Oscillospiraceae bacterium]